MANGQLRGLSPFLVSAFSFQHFSFCQSVALGGLCVLPPLFLLSTLCFLLLPGGGLAGLFKACLSGCFPNVNLRPCLCCANQPPVPDVAPGLHAAFPG